jgi:ATP:ADP antiporter, AAA family
MMNRIKTIVDIRKNEWPLALLMFTYFFLVITSFWILKPIKKALFITYFETSGVDLFSWHLQAPQAELIAKILNMFVAFIAVVVFSWISKKFHKQQLTFIFSAFFIVSYILYSFTINNPVDLTVWTFYLFGDLFSTLMVATFFTFLNDSVTPNKAKRLYGLIGLGGVVGGVFGTTFLRVFIDQMSKSGWLFICAIIAILIIVIAYFAGKLVDREEKLIISKPLEVEVKKSTGNPALEGALLVFRSKYLLSIVAIVGLYEILSTIMDFQFTSTVFHYLSGDAIGRHFSTVFVITNWVSMFVQLFLTSFIMRKYGLAIALAILPIMILLGSAGFMIFPVLMMGSMLNTADNGFSYSINQSAKETLYVPTTREEKYKAKAFIDMFVQRFAKAIAVGISLLITTTIKDFSSIRWLSLVTVIIVVLWLMAVRYAGRKFNELTAEATK